MYFRIGIVASVHGSNFARWIDIRPHYVVAINSIHIARYQQTFPSLFLSSPS